MSKKIIKALKTIDMCWITNNSKYTVKKTAEQDIPVFKIVKCSETDSIVSYFQEYEYTLGKQEECEMIIEFRTFSSSLRIYTGLHSYDIKLRKSILHVDGITNIYGPSGFMVTYSTYESAIMHCIIPKGAEYYENENGEIVSNMLKPISIEEL